MARNKGLKIAKGEYIAFIDSDDFVEKKYLEQLYLIDEDLSICGCFACDKTGDRIEVARREASRVETVTNENIVEWFESGSLYSVWTCMFKRSIIEKYDLQFDINTSRGEDTIFMFQYVSHCKRVRFVEEILYNYVYYGSGTLTTSGGVSNICSLGYLDVFLLEWFKEHKVVSKIFEGLSFWTRQQAKEQLLSTMSNEELSMQEKYLIYNAFFKKSGFVKYLDFFLRGESVKFRVLLGVRNPILLLAYGECKRILHNVGLKKR